MQSNLITGYLAANPELVGAGNKARVRIVLISNEYAGKDSNGAVKERQVRIPLTGWGGLANTINSNCRTGDQLIVRYRIENSKFEQDGEMKHGFNFQMLEMEFGSHGKANQLNNEQGAVG